MPPFDDIDTPASDELLSGMTEEEGGAGSVVKDPEAEPVVEPPKDAGEPAKKEEGVVEPAVEAKPEREPVIPRARFDELNSKLHAEREENERLRAQLERSSQANATAAEESVDIDALEQQYFDAMIDGDRDSAVRIRTQINNEIRTQAEARATEKATREVSEREQQNAFSKAVSETLASYPFLNSQSEEANAQAINDVVEWRDFYISKGDTPAAALHKAAAKIAPMYVKSAAKELDPADPMIEKPTDQRKNAALARNLVDSAAQPPAPVAGIGNRALPAAPKIETQRDWEKLSQSERDEILMNS